MVFTLLGRFQTLFFSTCLQDDLTSYIRRILEEAKEKWSKGEEPTREDGCFVSPVAYDIIQVKAELRDVSGGEYS